MTASWTDYAGEDNSTVLFGTEGVMRIYDDPAHSIVLTKKGGETEYYDVDKIQTNDDQTKSGVIDLFVRCLMNPEEKGIPAESVLPAMCAVFGAVASAETGKSVRVND